MRLVLLGSPGAGKGTASVWLADKLGVPRLVTSDLLKFEITKESILGLRIKDFMDRGELVPDDIVIQIVLGKLTVLDGFVLDGFPRTLNQARTLKDNLDRASKSLDFVVYLDVPCEIAMKRNIVRYTCKTCRFSPEPSETSCPMCGGDLEKRVDDDEETIIKRLEAYIKETQPLVDFYSHEGILLRIDANAPINEVHDRIILGLGLK